MLLPEKGRPPFATFYLLHGLSDDYTIWLRQTRIEMYVREWPLMVVMPDGYRGMYTKNEDGPDYAKHFGEDLALCTTLDSTPQPLYIVRQMT